MKSKSSKEAGFTLIELLMAMVIGLVVIGGLFNLVISQTKTYTIQNQLIEMQQNARIGLDYMVNALQMAGYDPLRAEIFGITKYENNILADSNDAGLFLETSAELYFTSDQDEDGELDNNTDQNGNGVIDRSEYEQLGFKVEAGSLKVATISPADGSISAWTTYAENIESMTVSYTYANGAVSTDVGLPDNGIGGRKFSDIRTVAIALTARTRNPDPHYTHPTAGDGYRRMKLRTELLPRNLGI